VSKASPKERAEKLLTRLAQESGGRAFFPKDVDARRRRLGEIAHDLHLQFTISYRMPVHQIKGFHKVEVLPAVKGKLKAITAAGYID